MSDNGTVWGDGGDDICNRFPACGYYCKSI